MIRFRWLTLALCLLLMACSAETAPQAEPTTPPATATTAAPTPTEPSTAIPPTEPPAESAVATEAVETEQDASIAAEPSPIVFGQTEEGAFFYGAEDAPVTVIDYSDFVWPTCARYVLTHQPPIVEDFVESGQVKLVFWPVSNHGNASLYPAVAMQCIGEQSAELAFDAHMIMFSNQSPLWRADRDHFVNLATEVGADVPAFETCYDDGSGVTEVLRLDAIRRDRGIFSQPVFDVNGTVLAGSSELYSLIESTVP